MDATPYISHEGPVPLRVLCFIGGLATTLVAGVGVVNIFSFLQTPPGYTLQVYEMLFGIACMVVEAKDVQWFERCRPSTIHWFRFLTVPGGKGVFYLLMGMLGMSLWRENIFVCVAGMYMTAMGCICLLVHMGMSAHLRSAGIDVTRTQAGHAMIPLDTNSAMPVDTNNVMIPVGTNNVRQSHNRSEVVDHQEWGGHVPAPPGVDFTGGEYYAVDGWQEDHASSEEESLSVYIQRNFKWHGAALRV